MLLICTQMKQLLIAVVTGHMLQATFAEGIAVSTLFYDHSYGLSMYEMAAVVVAYPQHSGTWGAHCRCRPQLPEERAPKQATDPCSTLCLGARAAHCPISSLCDWARIAPSKLASHCRPPGQTVAPGLRQSAVLPAEMQMYVQGKPHDHE